jgi:hypothetical protein
MLLSTSKFRNGNLYEKVKFMTINYPVTRVNGHKSSQRLVGVQSGTAVFGASPSIRITGVANPAEVLVVQQETSQTLQIGVEETSSLTHKL